MELFEKPSKRTMELMNKIEETMDNHNGMFGSAGTLCTFCAASEYDGKEGVIHGEWCPIKSMRKWILSNGGSLLP